MKINIKLEIENIKSEVKDNLDFFYHIKNEENFYKIIEKKEYVKIVENKEFNIYTKEDTPSLLLYVPKIIKNSEKKFFLIKVKSENVLFYKNNILDFDKLNAKEILNKISHFEYIYCFQESITGLNDFDKNRLKFFTKFTENGLYEFKHDNNIFEFYSILIDKENVFELKINKKNKESIRKIKIHNILKEKFNYKKAMYALVNEELDQTLINININKLYTYLYSYIEDKIFIKKHYYIKHFSNKTIVYQYKNTYHVLIKTNLNNTKKDYCLIQYKKDKKECSFIIKKGLKNLEFKKIIYNINFKGKIFKNYFIFLSKNKKVECFDSIKFLDMASSDDNTYIIGNNELKENYYLHKNINKIHNYKYDWRLPESIVSDNHNNKEYFFNNKIELLKKELGIDNNKFLINPETKEELKMIKLFKLHFEE